jgi:hypothetical protein
VDDTFVIWLHGSDMLKDFLSHLIGIHRCIQFTMEKESKGQEKGKPVAGGKLGQSQMRQ